MSLPAHFELRDGHKLPSMGFGTWAQGNKDWCKEATIQALKVGYRNIDGAWHYGVDRQIGEAIRESGVPRGEIFVTTKFWPNFHAQEDVAKGLEFTLRESKLDYVDLYLMHWPVAFELHGDLSKVYPHDPSQTESDLGVKVHNDGEDRPVMAKLDMIATWRGMEALVDAGKTRSIGVSNFSRKQLDTLLPHVRIPIAVNQIEAHPWLPNTAVVEHCRKHGIIVQAYSPFAGQNKTGETLVRDPTVLGLAKKNNMGVGALLLSWGVQRGTNPIGKTGTVERIRSNFLDVRMLSDEDIKTLDSLKRSPKEGRTVNFEHRWGVKLWDDDDYKE